MIKLITMNELHRLSRFELEALRRILLDLLMATDAGTADRRNLLASLENVDRVLGLRYSHQPVSL